MNNHYKPTR